MGEALFQLSVLLQTEASNDAALLLARMALYARGDDPIYLALLADILDAESRTADASAAYRQVPPDAPYGWQAEVKVGEELHRLGRDDEAVAYLKKLVESRTDRSEAAIELGDTLRATKQFADAVKAYDTAIARMGPTRARGLAVYYFRGIALERSGQWPLAEKDFKKALQLQPDHPYVLNYLGYTWVDRGEHLKEAIKMLQKAVEQKPDDGFIVDSLAWAYYRLGQYDKAVDLSGEGGRRWSPAIPCSTIIWAISIGRSGGTTRPASSGSARWPSSRMRTGWRPSRRSSSMGWIRRGAGAERGGQALRQPRPSA